MRKLILFLVFVFVIAVSSGLFAAEGIKKVIDNKEIPGAKKVEGVELAPEVKNAYWLNGKVKVSTSYYKDGGVKEVKLFRDKGTLMEDEKYDDDGNKTEESYWGGNGALEESDDGWAAMKWTYHDAKLVSECYYRDNGRLKERKLYNDLGDLVNRQYIGDDTSESEEFNPGPTVAGTQEEYYDKYGRHEATTYAEED